MSAQNLTTYRATSAILTHVTGGTGGAASNELLEVTCQTTTGWIRIGFSPQIWRGLMQSGAATGTGPAPAPAQQKETTKVRPRVRARSLKAARNRLTTVATA